MADHHRRVLVIIGVEGSLTQIPEYYFDRIKELHVVPSRLAGLITGNMVFTGDECGGLLGTHTYAYQRMREGKIPLWVPHIGTGRPLFPFSVYSTGLFDPVNWLAIVLFQGNTNRVLAFMGIVYVFFLTLGIYFWLQEFRFSAHAFWVSALLSCSSHLVQHFPNLGTWNQSIAGVLWITYFAYKLLKHRTITYYALFVGWTGFFYLNVFIPIFPSSLIGVGIVGISHGLYFRLSRKQFLINMGLLALLLAISLLIASPAIIAVKEFASVAAISDYNYIGYGVDFKQAFHLLAVYWLRIPITGLLSIWAVLYGLLRVKESSMYPEQPCSGTHARDENHLSCCRWIGKFNGLRRGFANPHRAIDQRFTWENSSSKNYLFFTVLGTSLIVFLGLAGIFDPIALFFGADIQHINLFAPLIMFCQSMLAAFGVEFLLQYSRSRKSWMFSAPVILLCGIFLYGLWNSIQPESLAVTVAAGLLLMLVFLGFRSDRTHLIRISPRQWTGLGIIALMVFILSPQNSLCNTWLSGWRLPAFDVRMALAALLSFLVYAVVRRNTLRQFFVHLIRRDFNKAHLFGNFEILFLLLVVVALTAPVALKNNVIGHDAHTARHDAEFQEMLGASFPEYRSTTLYPVQKGARLPEFLSYERADQHIIWVNHAPIFNFFDASGGMSLTPKNFAELLTFSNYGALFDSPENPANILFRDEFQQELAQGIHPFQTKYGRLLHMSRNGGYIWQPNPALWKYPGLKYVFSAEPLRHDGLLWLRDIENLHTFGRNLIKKVRQKHIYGYSVKDAYPLIYAPENISFTERFTEESLRLMEQEGRKESQFALIQDAARERSSIRQRASAVRISSLRYPVNGILFRVEADSDAYIVMSHNNFPGWQACIDGARTPILPANYAFMAIQVPAGTHEIELKFRNRNFLLALALSGGTLVCCVIAGIFIIRQ